MNTKTRITAWVSMLALAALVLSACGPAAPAEPTLDPNMVFTQVAETVMVSMTQTAQAMPPTPMPEPTATTAPTQPPAPTTPPQPVNTPLPRRPHPHRPALRRLGQVEHPEPGGRQGLQAVGTVPLPCLPWQQRLIDLGWQVLPAMGQRLPLGPTKRYGMSETSPNPAAPGALTSPA